MTNDEYLKELASRGDGSLQAWFDAEHVDANPHGYGMKLTDEEIEEAVAAIDWSERQEATPYEPYEPDTIRNELQDNGLLVQDEHDSDEKLEADIAATCYGMNADRYASQKAYCKRHGLKVDEENVMANHEGHVLMTVISHMLERKERITERKCLEHAAKGDWLGQHTLGRVDEPCTEKYEVQPETNLGSNLGSEPCTSEADYVQGSEVDSDEKLEADVLEAAEAIYGEGYNDGSVMAWNPNAITVGRNLIIALLARKVELRCEHLLKEKSDRIFELHNGLADALERNDELKAKLAIAELKASDDFKPECDICDRATMIVEIEGLQAKVDELNVKWSDANQRWADANAEAEKWRQKCDELSEELELANAKMRSIETGSWHEKCMKMTEKVNELISERDYWRNQMCDCIDATNGCTVNRDTDWPLPDWEPDAKVHVIDAYNVMREERDYWKQEVQWCINAAYPPNHSPERGYNPDVMAYPDRNGCTTPSTLISAMIDGLREERGEQYMGLFRDCQQYKDECDTLRDHVSALLSDVEDMQTTIDAQAKTIAECDAEIERLHKLIDDDDVLYNGGGAKDWYDAMQEAHDALENVEKVNLAMSDDKRRVQKELDEMTAHCENQRMELARKNEDVRNLNMRIREMKNNLPYDCPTRHVRRVLKNAPDTFQKLSQMVSEACDQIDANVKRLRAERDELRLATEAQEDDGR